MSAAELFPDPTDGPGPVRAVAAALRRLSDRSAVVNQAARAAAATLGPAWQGPAAESCRTELAAAASLVAASAGPLREASQVVDRYADAVARSGDEVVAVRSAYESDRQAHTREMDLLVARAGRSLARSMLVANLWSRELGAMDRHHRRYAQICDDLRRSARAAGRSLSTLAAQVVPSATAGGTPVPAIEGSLAILPLLRSERSRWVPEVPGATPPLGAAPGAVRAWWSLLTTRERARAVAAHPAVLGSMDGLPAVARSEANETVLRRMLAGLGKPGGTRIGGGPVMVNALAVAAELRRARRGTDPLTRRPVTAHLLVFAPAAFDGEGRAAISVGDLDTADNVAVIVPGLNASLRRSWSTLVSSAARITAAGRRADPSRSTATIAWMGYDAPSWTQAVGRASAERGADLLERDLVGLRAARASPPHLTLVGHSYGSTTAGAALRERATGVTDLVALGSPGMTVERASRLHLPGAHVFVGSASRDPVGYFDRFGKDPSHASFGAVRFRAEDRRRSRWRMDVDDHLRYFDPGGESLANIARIVVGDYDDVTRAAYRGEAPLIPDGIGLDPEAYREPARDVG